MNSPLKRVSIAGTGSFLPGDPVPNDRIDQVLGPLDGAPSRVQAFIQSVGKHMLAGSGVEYRHFAVNHQTHELTHSVASLGEEACRRALQDANLQPSDIEFLVLSSSNFDKTTPPTSVLLQERLGIESCAEMEIHSNCSGVGKAVMAAFDSLRTGRYKTALVVYPQLSSVYLRSGYMNVNALDKKPAMLRYILADGAGAVVMRTAESTTGEVPHEILGAYIESVGGNRPEGMAAGGGVHDMMGSDDQVRQMFTKGSHHLTQDFAAVNRDAGRLLYDGTVRMVNKLGINPKQVDHCVFSIPTKQLYEDNVKRFMEFFSITQDQVKFRARNTGYCGGASMLLHLDEMARNGELKPGQLVVVHSVESSKWMTAGFVVKW